MLSFLHTSRGLRPSRFHCRHAAFVALKNKSVGAHNRRSIPPITFRRLPFSSLARFDYNEEEEKDGMELQPNRNPPQRPPPPRPPPRRSALPPPRARRLPPTLESNNNVGISNSFPEFPVSTTGESEEDALDYYNPNAENRQAYGFYTNPTTMEIMEESDTHEKSRFDDEDTLYNDVGDTRMPPVSDAFFHNQYQEDVPNPHNYWGDDDSTNKDTATTSKAILKTEKVSFSKNDNVIMSPDEHKEDLKEDAVNVPLSPVMELNNKQEDSPNTQTYAGDMDAGETTTTPSQRIPTAKDIKEAVALTATYTPLPKPSMPPRANFRSQPPNDDNRNHVYVQASSGNAITSSAEMLTLQLNQLEQAIYAQNNHKAFNINSPKQVSLVLFGKAGQSTNKSTLEAIGGAGNVLADLILQYRSLARQISRLDKRQEDKSNGRLVTNLSAATRPTSTLTRRRNESINEANGASHDNDDDVVEGDPLLLVDASAYIWRAYYSMPPLHRKDGMPVGAVLGFCNMLNRLVLERMLEGKCPRLVLVFDAKGRTFRHDLYNEYKANRKECPVDLIPQFDLIRQAAQAYGIQQLEAPNFEADDVIATLATMALREGVDANILSGDKDLMQLITPQDMFPSIQMVDPMTMSRVSHDVVVSKWGVTPDKLGDVLALAGDSADNIPGVPGIGPKIAASLISEYGSLDELFQQVDNVKQKARREKLMNNVENARLSRELVELKRELPMDKMTFPENISSAAELRMAPLDGERLLAFYKDMGLNDLQRRVEARLNKKKVVKTAKKYNNRRQKTEVPKPGDFKDVPF